MTVKLSDNDLTYLDLVVERLRLGVTGLPYAAIHHKNGRVRVDSILNLDHLIEQGLLLLMST